MKIQAMLLFISLSHAVTAMHDNSSLTQSDPDTRIVLKGIVAKNATGVLKCCASFEPRTKTYRGYVSNKGYDRSSPTSWVIDSEEAEWRYNCLQDAKNKDSKITRQEK